MGYQNDTFNRRKGRRISSRNEIGGFKPISKIGDCLQIELKIEQYEGKPNFIDRTTLYC
jgi:hypothetical protein